MRRKVKGERREAIGYGLLVIGSDKKNELDGVQLIFFAKHLRKTKKKCTFAASFLQKHTKKRTKTLQKHTKIQTKLLQKHTKI